MSEQLESLLRQSGVVTEVQLNRALEKAAQTRSVSLLEILFKEEQVSEDAVADLFASQLKLQRVRLAAMEFDPEALERVPAKLARKHMCLPIAIERRVLALAMMNPLDGQAIQAIEFASALAVRPLAATRTEIMNGIEDRYGAEDPLEAFAPSATAIPAPTLDPLIGIFEPQSSTSAPGTPISHSTPPEGAVVEPTRSHGTDSESSSSGMQTTDPDEVGTHVPEPPIKPRAIRILVVDDDADIRAIVSATLRKLAIPVEIDLAEDGDVAVEKALASPPDMIVLDVMMPRMDGFTVCRTLRENIRTASVPVLMLTASADQASRIQGYMVGTNDYMAKPFLPVDLKLRVTRLLRRTYGI